MDLNLRIIGSASSGNCAVIWSGWEALMVDCGLGVKYTVKAIRNTGLSMEYFGGVLISHLHSDHIRDSMLRYLYRQGVPFYCHSRISSHFENRLKKCGVEADGSRVMSVAEKTFKVGHFNVDCFTVPHDTFCCGFRIGFGSKNITIATDMGFADDSVLEKFINSDIIVIESNHCRKMLELSERPYWVKRRIAEHHMSNTECGNFLEKVVRLSDSKPSAVVLAHLSTECNSSRTVFSSVGRRILKSGARVIAAEASSLCETLTV